MITFLQEPLSSWQQHFGHPQESEHILCQGKKMHLEDFKELYFSNHQTELPRNLRYDHQGITPISVLKWTKLTETHTKSAKSIDGYSLQIHSRLNRNSSGCHSWIRVCSPTGETSVGFCGGNSLNLSSKPLKIFSPDPFEAKQGSHLVTHHPLSKEKFEKLKNYIEKLQKDPNLKYHALSYNCAHFVSQVAQKAGIEISCEKTLFFQLLGSVFLFQNFIKFSSRFYKILEKICKVASFILKPAILLTLYSMNTFDAYFWKLETKKHKYPIGTTLKKITHLMLNPLNVGSSVFTHLWQKQYLENEKNLRLVNF